MTTKTGLKFYPASHRYKLDGEWVQGVTTILSGAMPKPAMPKWSAKTVAEYVAQNRNGIELLYNMGEGPMIAALKDIPWQQRDEAGRRGTEVHDLAERYLKGEKIEVPDAITGHVESCVQFIEDWKLEPVLIEQTIGSREHQYAGRLDIIADSCEAPRSIFDWKTAKSGIYGETSMQLVAYAMAEFYGEDGDEKPMADLGIKESWGVHIRADGYDAYPLAYGPEIYAEFVTLLAASRINKRIAGNWKIPGSGYVGLSHQIESTDAA